MSEHTSELPTDPSYGETPRVRQVRLAARRADHQDNAVRIAIGDEHVKSYPASKETRRAAVESTREMFNRQKVLKMELSTPLAQRANTLLNVMEYISVRNQMEAVAELPGTGALLDRLGEQIVTLRPLYEEGMDSVFPKLTDSDGTHREAFEQELSGHGDEARARRKELEGTLRQQALTMGFRVSSVPSKKSESKK